MRILLLLCLTLAATAFEAVATKAGLASTLGTVQKQVGGAWSAAQPGDLLVPGNRVRTGKNSLAVVLLDDVTSLRLGPSSELVITTLDKMQLATGRVWVNAVPAGRKGTTFELQGPNAVAAVKGTSFEMTDTRMLVWSGQVECGGQLVRTGYEFTGGQVREFTMVADTFQNWNLQCDGVLQTVAYQGVEGVLAARTDNQKAGALPAAITRARPAPTPTPQLRRPELTPAFLRLVGDNLPPFTP